MVTKEVSQRQTGFDDSFAGFTVDGHFDGKLSRHHGSLFETAVGFLLG
jgi:hypothetical protein